MEKQYALISLSDKTGIDVIGQALKRHGIVALSTGGTAAALRKIEGLEVIEVSDYTGFAEMLDGRVKTLHPKIHGGLLARTDLPAHMETIAKHGIEVIRFVFVNLYQLEKKLAEPGATKDDILEETDIGGPAMLRSAAKGERIVVCDPADYPRVIDAIELGTFDPEFIRELRAKVFTHTAKYDLLSARYHSGGDTEGLIGTKALQCKYGENAWQAPAALYSTGTDDPLALDRFELLAGQPPSYNNLCDLDRLLQTSTHIAAAFRGGDAVGPLLTAVGGKHGNPCGAAIVRANKEATSADRRKVLERMIDGHKRAIFGGLVMVNFDIDVEDADVLLAYNMPRGRRVLDGIIAPKFTEGAVELLKRKEDRCRFLANPALRRMNEIGLDQAKRYRYVRGGFLVQPNYTFVPNLGLDVDPADRSDLLLAWAIGSTSNTNTVTLVKDEMLIGNGVGQQDRVAVASSRFSGPSGPATKRNCTARSRTLTASSRSRTGLASLPRRAFAPFSPRPGRGRMMRSRTPVRLPASVYISWRIRKRGASSATETLRLGTAPHGAVHSFSETKTLPNYRKRFW